MKTLAEALRNHLVTEGIVRLPNQAAGSKNLPVCYIDLLTGAPDPNELTGVSACNTTVHLSEVAGLPSLPIENFKDDTNIRIIIRTKANLDGYNQGWKTGKLISRLLRDKQCYLLDDLKISTTQIVQPFTRLPQIFEQTGYAFVLELNFVLRWSDYSEF